MEAAQEDYGALVRVHGRSLELWSMTDEKPQVPDAPQGWEISEPLRRSLESLPLESGAAQLQALSEMKPRKRPRIACELRLHRALRRPSGERQSGADGAASSESERSVVAEDVIRARRIELLDAQGNLRLVLDGGEQSEDGPPRMFLYGPDGRVWIIMCSFDPVRASR